MIFLLKKNWRALPSGTPSGKGLYLTVYPLSRPNTDIVRIEVGGNYVDKTNQIPSCHLFQSIGSLGRWFL